MLTNYNPSMPEKGFHWFRRLWRITPGFSLMLPGIVFIKEKWEVHVSPRRKLPGFSFRIALTKPSISKKHIMPTYCCRWVHTKLVFLPRNFSEEIFWVVWATDAALNISAWAKACMNPHKNMNNGSGKVLLNMVLYTRRPWGRKTAQSEQEKWEDSSISQPFVT